MNDTTYLMAIENFPQVLILLVLSYSLFVYNGLLYIRIDG